mmetsp:Transcript_91062/g.281610  ORF Transcript_91062/g.281610 Transcript_91062/m.281610 type:complete len:302 (-) Transcript_91062:148-1053(-)
MPRQSTWGGRPPPEARAHGRSRTPNVGPLPPPPVCVVASAASKEGPLAAGSSGSTSTAWQRTQRPAASKAAAPTVNEWPAGQESSSNGTSKSTSRFARKRCAGTARPQSRPKASREAVETRSSVLGALAKCEWAGASPVPGVAPASTSLRPGTSSRASNQLAARAAAASSPAGTSARGSRPLGSSSQAMTPSSASTSDSAPLRRRISASPGAKGSTNRSARLRTERIRAGGRGPSAVSVAGRRERRTCVSLGACLALTGRTRCAPRRPAGAMHHRRSRNRAPVAGSSGQQRTQRGPHPLMG